MTEQYHIRRLLFGISCLIPFFLFGQSSLPEDLSLIEAPGQLLKADAFVEDEEGWKHYYQKKEQKLLLSIQSYGQDIGSLDQQLSISCGLLSNYGKGANDLSGADYVDNSIWLTMNRYWRISKPNPIGQAVRLRFYFTQEDVQDIRNSLEKMNRTFSNIHDLQFYILNGGSVHPFSMQSKVSRAQFSLFEESPAPRIGRIGDAYYVEYILDNLACSGSGGRMIPLEGETYSVKGRIMNPFGSPIEDIYIESAIPGASIRTDDDGAFALANLKAGESYQIQPYSLSRPNENVTVLDLLAMSAVLSGEHQIESPFAKMGSDLDRSGQLDEQDLALLQAIVLGDTTAFQQQSAWHFTPTSEYQSKSGKRKLEDLPEGLTINNLLNNITEQDFIGIKIGDLWEEMRFPDKGLAIPEPGFILENVAACGKHQTIRVPLKIERMKDIRAFQFTIEWDPEILKFTEVNGFNLPYLSEKNIGAFQATEGKLSIAWFAPEPVPAFKKKDGTIICFLEFQVTSTNQTQTKIDFTESLSAIQVLSDQLSTQNVFFTTGKVQFKGGDAKRFDQIDVQAANCKGSGGAIRVEVSGGNPPYHFRWDHGSSSQNAENLPTGNYRLTVYDKSDCPLISPMIEVPTSDPPKLEHIRVGHVLCEDQQQGSVSFKTTGGKPPYTYLWNDGTKNHWHTSLAPGQHTLTVTDRAGCQYEHTFLIERGRHSFLNFSLSPSDHPRRPNGMIRVTGVEEATTPVSYQWSNGAQGPSAQKLSPGIHGLTLTDGNGCTNEFAFTISDQLNPDAEVVLHDQQPKAGQYFALTIPAATDREASLLISDLFGGRVSEKRVLLYRGENQYHLKAPTKAGVYSILLYEKGGERWSGTIEVKKQ
jgi:hypothetical protein